ncbi:Short-chain dehydrogenase/reductase SDR [Penicillium malachiteum]|uniref:Short-chain dehydrogenase/reductase SDR n=1 Tax=Penicillium malachiteum TaxID=1324776 RepID=A0AAD6HC47_9EURO|nr:Short-chain dehydrogenase/reductase SDR [Penicillium malachiteum]
MSNMLISGTNKGIGRALVEKYLTRDYVTVVASVHNPASPDAVSLSTLPTGHSSRVIVVKIDAASDTDAKEAVASLVSHRVSSLDIVIANAGVFSGAEFKTIADAKISEIQNNLNVNTVGPIRLFQATLPLLLKFSSPRVILMSSLMDTISGIQDIPLKIASYGANIAW